jgi:hypothetical protein
LLPREVLDGKRGFQSADWQLHFTQRTAFEILEEIASCETARDLLDIDAMRSAIGTWPSGEGFDWKMISTYTSQLPIALATGIFIKETEEGWRRSA